MKKRARKHKKNRSAYLKILAISFLLFTFIMVGLNLTKKPKEFSEAENRMLNQKPKFTVERLFEGRYTKKYESYKSDQFIGRDFWIGIRSQIDRLLGRNVANNVYKSANGYLIEDFAKPDQKNLDKNIKAINDFAKKYSKIKQYMLVAPNAVNILKDKLPIFAPVNDQKPYLENLKKSLDSNIKFIDTTNALTSHKDEYIYYRTDHHWTTLGAHYAFLEAAKQMDLKVSTDSYDVEPVTNSFYGTLSSKSGFKIKEPDVISVYLPKNKKDESVVSYVEEKKKASSIYDSSVLNIKDKYEVFLKGNHPLVEINTTSSSGKTLLLIKDSYANSFVQFLTPYYSKIVMVDPRYYYEDIYKLMESEGITDLMYLYNGNTFFSDTSLAPVLNNE